MGNNCESVCKEPNASIINEVSESYLKLVQSVKVEEEFPQEFIPETVKEKVRLLGLKWDPTHSQLWKYQQPRNTPQDQPYVIYTMVSKESLLKEEQFMPQPQKVVVASSQPEASTKNPARLETFNPSSFAEAAIFVFKSKSKNTNETNPYSESQDLVLQEAYFGSINEKMTVDNATKIFKNGEYYQGNINNNQLDGKGIMTSALGNHTYNGQWSKNKPNGQGVEQLDNKFVYEGMFSNGKWNGPGKLTLLNPTNPVHLEGNFVNGTLEGQGIVKNRLNELVYEGQFQNGKEHGQGKWFGPNGDTYEGDFVQGRKQGTGKYVFGTGGEYEGYFKNGRPEGKGELTKNGVTTRGHWYNGENILIFKD